MTASTRGGYRVQDLGTFGCFVLRPMKVLKQGRFRFVGVGLQCFVLGLGVQETHNGECVSEELLSNSRILVIRVSMSKAINTLDLQF